eukprot:gene18683-658_t
MFITTLALTVNLFASAARVSVVAGRPNNPPKASDFTWLKVDGLCQLPSDETHFSDKIEDQKSQDACLKECLKLHPDTIAVNYMVKGGSPHDEVGECICQNACECYLTENWGSRDWAIGLAPCYGGGVGPMFHQPPNCNTGSGNPDGFCSIPGQTTTIHPTRPGGSSACYGQCAEECPEGQACVFSFNPAGSSPCGCGTPNSGPSPPRRTTTVTTVTTPARTIPNGIPNCDGWIRNNSMPVDGAATCSTLCKDHRLAMTRFVPTEGVNDPLCCCGLPHGQAPKPGDARESCCAVPDLPEPTRTPDAAGCNMGSVRTCATATGAVVSKCTGAIIQAITDCDILAPPTSQSYKNCNAAWICAQDAAGSDFLECCDCIESTVQKFVDPDIDIPCEALRLRSRQ